MKSNIILISGSSDKKRKMFLEEAHKLMNFSYVKLEAVLSSVSETLKRRITEEESIKFFDKYIEKIYDDRKIYIIDTNECKNETLDKFIKNRLIHVILLDNLEIKDNKLYMIEENEYITGKLEKFRKENEESE